MQITHGCIRLYPEDIEHLFAEVPLGMAVRIVNQRIKTGWVDGALYLEVHHPLDGVDPKDVEDLTALTRSIVAATAQRRVIIDWDTAERVFQEAERHADAHLGRPLGCARDHRRAVISGANAEKRPKKTPRLNRGVSCAHRMLDLLRHGLLEHAIDLLVDRFDGRRILLGRRQGLVRGALRARGG